MARWKDEMKLNHNFAQFLIKIFPRINKGKVKRLRDLNYGEILVTFFFLMLIASISAMSRSIGWVAWGICSILLMLIWFIFLIQIGIIKIRKAGRKGK
jgi:uncharacterized membrane protein YhaH (DUF805 family)